MPRIPRRAFFRPLQGNAYVVRGGGRPIGLAGQYQRAMDRANKANEQRYQKILQGYDDLRGRVMGDLEGVGQQERADINRQYDQSAANARQYLVNRGFGNSNLWLNANQGTQRERMAALGRLNDRLRQQRSAADIGITQGRLGVMERRSDVGPDYNQMIRLAQGLGASPYGQAGMPGPGIRGVTFNQDPYRQMWNQAYMQNLAAAMAGRGGGMPMQRSPMGYGMPQRLARYGGMQSRPLPMRRTLMQADIPKRNLQYFGSIA